MSERYDDFPAFLEAMQGKRLLHLGHKRADCDALGSAYALSRVLPGDVGFAEGVQNAAADLAIWLGLDFLVDPDPAAYEYVIIYDAHAPFLVGLPMPARYAIFDHHEPGGHRFADLHCILASGAEWAWVRPVEATGSVLIDLFQAQGITIDRKMAVALAAGIITDTAWLQQANGPALSRLGTVLNAAGLYVEDVLAIIDSPDRRATRRPAMLDAVRGLQERASGGWSILAAQTDTQDHGFAVANVLNHLGADVCIISFPKDEMSMVMVECGGVVVERTGIDLKGLMKEMAPQVKAKEIWGTRSRGRIIAPAPGVDLMASSMNAVADALLPNSEREVK